MRYIAKGAEPKEFTDWKLMENEDWKPTYNDLSGDVKKAVYSSLKAEQGHICCYCERELVAGDFHIDHLNPQCINAGDDLIYENFLCSCLDKTAKGDPLHCGKLKGDVVIEVHPLLIDCYSKFEFTALGEIKGRGEEVNRTIKTLGLDVKKLNDMRKLVIDPFLDPEIEEVEFRKFVQGYLQRSPTGRINPFHSVIMCLFG